MIDRIKELRIKLFKTQTNFANSLGLKSNSVTEYERGKSFLKPEKIAYLIENYNVNANWLLAGKGNMLLNDTDTINDKETISDLKKEIEQLRMENQILKDLLKK